MEKTPLIDSKYQPKKALVVFKKSRLEFVKEQGSMAEKADLLPLIPAHERHHRAIDRVEKALKDFGLQFESIGRSELSLAKLKDRLIITVGGDGTLLDVSHHCIDDAILGVNSDPKSSVGALCLTDGDSFKDTLKKIIEGHLKPTALARLAIFLDRQEQSPWALNDVLFCHKNPAAMARFFLSKDEVIEHHRSSGLWVSSAAGSTGAIFSAGVAPIDFHLHKALFHVREPFASDQKVPKLLNGSFKAQQKLKIKSDMGDGKLFIDGPHRSLDINFGQDLEISLSSHPLWLFDGPVIAKKRNEIIQYRQMIHKL